MKITPRRGVVSQQMDGEYVILDTNSNQYFGLNEVGARFWQLVLNDYSMEAIQSELLDEFDVDADELRADLTTLIGQLDAANLIIIDD